MIRFRSSLAVKVICSILILTFVTLDIAWAHPDDGTSRQPAASTLAIPPVTQINPTSDFATEFKQSVLSEAGVIISVLDIAKYVFGDDVNDIGPLPIGNMEGVLHRELKKYKDAYDIDLSIVSFNDDIVTIFLVSKDGKKHRIHIAKKDNLAMQDLAGYDWLISEKYAVKVRSGDLKATKTRSLATNTDIISVVKGLKRDIATLSDDDIDKAVSIIEKHLRGLPLSISEEGIQNISRIIRGRNLKIFKGEPADIVDENDIPVCVTEIGFAHILGLRHRTANAYVMTPDGKLILQRRAPGGRKYELYLSIFGGHVKAGHTYGQGILEELKEELDLKGEPQGRLISIGMDDYDEAGISNKEKRQLFAYILTDEEYREMQTISENLNRKKMDMTRDEFTEWLCSGQAKQPGFKEIWGYYEVDIDEVLSSSTAEHYVTDDKVNSELHYLTVTDHFKDGLVTEPAFFTPDLLERTVRNDNGLAKLPEALGRTKHQEKQPGVAISGPVAKISNPILPGKSIIIRRIITSALLMLICPLAFTEEIAISLPSQSLLSAHPFVFLGLVLTIGIGAGIALFFMAWRMLAPVNWYSRRLYSKKERVRQVSIGYLLNSKNPIALLGIAMALKNGDPDDRLDLITALESDREGHKLLVLIEEMLENKGYIELKDKVLADAVAIYIEYGDFDIEYQPEISEPVFIAAGYNMTMDAGVTDSWDDHWVKNIIQEEHIRVVPVKQDVVLFKNATKLMEARDDVDSRPINKDRSPGQLLTLTADRIIVIGDLHTEPEALDAVIARIDKRELKSGRTKVILTGDIVSTISQKDYDSYAAKFGPSIYKDYEDYKSTSGNRAYALLGKIARLKCEYPDGIFILPGNGEMDFTRKSASEEFMRQFTDPNKGKILPGKASLYKSARDFIDSMPFFAIVEVAGERYLVSHGGVVESPSSEKALPKDEEDAIAPLVNFERRGAEKPMVNGLGNEDNSTSGDFFRFKQLSCPALAPDNISRFYPENEGVTPEESIRKACARFGVKCQISGHMHLFGANRKENEDLGIAIDPLIMHGYISGGLYIVNSMPRNKYYTYLEVTRDGVAVKTSQGHPYDNPDRSVSSQGKGPSALGIFLAAMLASGAAFADGAITFNAVKYFIYSNYVTIGVILLAAAFIVAGYEYCKIRSGTYIYNDVEKGRSFYVRRSVIKRMISEKLQEQGVPYWDDNLTSEAIIAEAAELFFRHGDFNVEYHPVQSRKVWVEDSYNRNVDGGWYPLLIPGHFENKLVWPSYISVSQSKAGDVPQGGTEESAPAKDPSRTTKDEGRTTKGPGITGTLGILFAAMLAMGGAWTDQGIFSAEDVFGLSVISNTVVIALVIGFVIYLLPYKRYLQWRCNRENAASEWLYNKKVFLSLRSNYQWYDKSVARLLIDDGFRITDHEADADFVIQATAMGGSLLYGAVIYKATGERRSFNESVYYGTVMKILHDFSIKYSSHTRKALRDPIKRPLGVNYPHILISFFVAMLVMSKASGQSFSFAKERNELEFYGWLGSVISSHWLVFASLVIAGVVSIYLFKRHQAKERKLAEDRELELDRARAKAEEERAEFIKLLSPKMDVSQIRFDKIDVASLLNQIRSILQEYEGFEVEQVNVYGYTVKDITDTVDYPVGSALEGGVIIRTSKRDARAGQMVVGDAQYGPDFIYEHTVKIPTTEVVDTAINIKPSGRKLEDIRRENRTKIHDMVSNKLAQSGVTSWDESAMSDAIVTEAVKLLDSHGDFDVSYHPEQEERKEKQPYKNDSSSYYGSEPIFTDEEGNTYAIMGTVENNGTPGEWHLVSGYQEVIVPRVPARLVIMPPHIKLDTALIRSATEKTSPEVSGLFAEIEAYVNNVRARTVNAANGLTAALARGQESMPETDLAAPIDRNRPTAEVMYRIAGVIAAATEKVGAGLPEDRARAIEELKNGLDELEANGIFSAFISQTRTAKQQKQKFLIGIGTGWIPAYDKMGSLQHSVTNSFLNEMRSIIHSKMVSWGLGDAEIITGSDNDVANALKIRADSTGTSLSNVVAIASQNSVEESDAFLPLRSTETEARAYLIGINPEKLLAAYEKYGESLDHQIDVDVTHLLLTAVDFAASGELPHIPMVDNDRSNAARRILIMSPDAKLENYGDLKTINEGRKTALASA